MTRAVGQSSKGAIRDFLDRYRDAREKQIEQQAQRLSAQLGLIRKGLEAAKQRRAEHSRVVAPDLNVFNILRVADQESAHSNFIAELLDPQGTHGQGTLFLEHFLNVCKQECDELAIEIPHLESWASDISVSREAAILRGRFDLLIFAPGNMCCVIENKINAPEGDTQLGRYRNWLVKRPEPATRKLLIFLTPTGRSAKSIPENEYIRLSYVKHIRGWLLRCMQTIEPLNVRSLVDEYLRTIIAKWGESQDAGAEP